MKSSVAVFITPLTSSTKSPPAKVFSVDFLKRSSQGAFAAKFQEKLPAPATIARIRKKLVRATGAGFPSISSWLPKSRWFANANGNAPALSMFSTSCLCITLPTHQILVAIPSAALGRAGA
jgi:hypothetical protein